MAHSRQEQLALIHQHRLNQGRCVLNEAAHGLEELKRQRQEATTAFDNIDALLDEAENLIASLGDISPQGRTVLEQEARTLCAEDDIPPLRVASRFKRLDILEVDESDGLEALWQHHIDYARHHEVDTQASLAALLPREDLERLSKRIEEDFTHKNARCDSYDYMIAGTVGILGGLVDIFLVGAPNEGIVRRHKPSES